MRKVPDVDPLFPNLRRAMKANQEAARALPDMTYYRYVGGHLPKNWEWLLRYPDMLRALLKDAEAMTEEDWQRFQDQVDTRATAQKGRRARGKK